MGQTNNLPRFDHAVVLGGSIAGLVTARVLSRHFTRVTVVERDELTDDTATRQGAPQGNHAHAFLAWGLANLSRLFPGLRECLIADGAVQADMSNDLPWKQHGAHRRKLDSGYEGFFMSRPLVEKHLRRRVQALPNVTLLTGTSADSLLTSMDRRYVTGVVIRPARADAGQAIPLFASLVVDASGRRSRTPARLKRLGFAPPEESEIGIDMTYATRLFHRSASQMLRTHGVLISPSTPSDRRFGLMLPIEGERWILSLGGWHGDRPATDDKGFLDFASSLAAPDIVKVVTQAAPLSEVMVYTIPSSLRRHYERLARFPEGLLVLGDAVASFNPFYGPGVTSATLQAMTLDRLLESRRLGEGLDGLWREYFPRAAKVADVPWRIASGADFRYPETTGKRPALINVSNRYMERVQRAAAIDCEVARTLLAVMNLRSTVGALLAPRIVYRTWKALRGPARTETADAKGSPLARSNYRPDTSLGSSGTHLAQT